jgi:hypothetical protein
MKRALAVAIVIAFAGHARAQTSPEGRALYDEGVALEQRGDCTVGGEPVGRARATR